MCHVSYISASSQRHPIKISDKKKKPQNNSLNLNISPDLQESEAEVARGSEKALDLNLQLIENIVERMSQYPKLSMYRKVIQTIVS